jgi:hypothetical protein
MADYIANKFRQAFGSQDSGTGTTYNKNRAQQQLKENEDALANFKANPPT